MGTCVKCIIIMNIRVGKNILVVFKLISNGYNYINYSWYLNICFASSFCLIKFMLFKYMTIIDSDNRFSVT